jgi:hypothetical protein
LRSQSNTSAQTGFVWQSRGVLEACSYARLCKSWKA